MLHAPATTRIYAGLAAGVVVACLVCLVAPFQTALLAGWNAMALVIVVWVLLVVLHCDAAKTAALAQREDYSHGGADFLQVGSCAASALIVAVSLLQAGKEEGITRVLSTLHALLGVVLAWAVVHSVYALRYARLYYQEGGGIDFNDSGDPDYRDFAYVAVTIGMTYQIADTNITSKAMRRTALHHSLLSFAFGTAILAVTINVVASLLT